MSSLILDVSDNVADLVPSPGEWNGDGGFDIDLSTITGDIDLLIGENGNPDLGDDRVFLGSGNDFLSLSDGNDIARGRAGDDIIRGGRGNDALYGGEGDDSVYGGAGNDFLAGNLGNDFLSGGAGNDRILGGAGDDVIYGGAGNDVIRGGAGSDTVYGGPGRDRYILRPEDYADGSVDTYADFNDGVDGKRIDTLIIGPTSGPVTYDAETGLVKDGDQVIANIGQNQDDININLLDNGSWELY